MRERAGDFESEKNQAELECRRKRKGRLERGQQSRSRCVIAGWRCFPNVAVNAILVTFRLHSNSDRCADQHQRERYARIEQHRRREEAEDHSVADQHCRRREDDASVGDLGELAIVRPRALSKLGDGHRAVDETAEKPGQLDATRAVKFQQDIICKTQSRDEQHGDPGGPWLDEAPGIDASVR